MKKLILSLLAFIFVSVPLLMVHMHGDTNKSQEFATCVSNCFEETALAKSRIVDQFDLDVLPVPPTPDVLAASAGFSAALFAAFGFAAVVRDRQSLFCTYLE